ncbi:MAG: hypothetical protein GXO79_16390 [Chlorobi bacterium]|nr:hypothetical protein [Chlorobiota bacterium]
MNNPIVKSPKYFYSFLSIWIVLAFLQSLIVYFYNDFTFGEAFADGFVFNGLYALLSLFIWFVVNYNDFENQTVFNIVLNHLGTVVILTFLWLLVGRFLLTNTFGFSKTYISFLQQTFIWRFVIGVMFYFVIVLIYYLIIYYNNLQEKIKHEAELNILLKETELNALKSQINPHFLFNSLNSISSLTISTPEKAHDMIIKLGEYLRYSLVQDETKFTKFSDEINNVMTYLEIEKIRFGNKLTIKKSIDPECYQMKIPVMILQPLYENAIKHGVYESTGNVKIETICHCRSDYLKINIKNNFDPEAVHNKGEGIGLQNIKDRMKLIYERTDLVNIEKKSKSFTVELLFPVIEESEN